jgi:hypothetical protein
MKLIKTKEIVLTPLLISIIFSVLISNSINNQQIIAQQQLSPEEIQQLSPEEIENEILRGNIDIGSVDSDTPTTESSVQLLSNDSVLEYESPAHGIRIQYPDRWQIMIESTPNSSLSLRFNSPLENDTDIYRENVLFEINTISNNTALDNYTSGAITSYLESYPDLKFSEVSSTNLTNAIPANKLVASRTQEGLDFMQIVAINEDKIYTITYTSDKTRYSTYLPIIEEMINSFEVT